MELIELRGDIDKIDNELIRLFCARMEIAAQIAEYKKANDLPVFVPEREAEKLTQVVEIAGPEMAEYTRELFAALFQLSRDYQFKQIR